MMDQTEKKEELLKLSQQTFPVIEQITAGMPGGFFIYHADGDENLIYANKALINMYGCDDLEDFKNYTGYIFRGLVHRDDWEDASKSIRSQIQGKDDMDYVEYRIIRKDGGIRWVEDYGHFVRTDSYGDVFYVFIKDVTAEHFERLADERFKEVMQQKLRALARLQHETTSLNIVHEVLRSGMWSMEFDDQGNMESVIWSDEFRHMLGYTDTTDFPNTLDSWLSLIHQEDRERVEREYFDTILDYTGGKVFDAEYQLLTKNRGYRWFRSTGKLSRQEDGTPVTYVGTFIDITKSVQTTQELQAQKKLLEEALEQAQHSNRAKTVFLNNMSHDIRTPMNAIIGFAALASTHLDNKELVKDYLSKITTSSNHLLSLINDVLDMSRIESGKMRLDQKECNLSEIMHDLKTIVQADVCSKQMEFYIDTLDVINENIICDKLRLNQVLLNIISNALKFTPPRGTISVRIIEKPNRHEGYGSYEFKIRDNGIGMSEEFLKHIFEPFERERTSTVSGAQGTGLGMTITKNIVDMMDGSISVESQEGKGTEFSISFVFRLSGKPCKPEKIPELTGLRALVADDDFNTCASVTKMLSSMGMRSEWTTSGKEAVLRTQLALEQDEEFNAYILDWMMPDMNGIEAVRRIRKLVGEKNPIIIMTAYDWADVETEAKEAGVTAFCSKPLFLSELRSTLVQAGRTIPEQQTSTASYTEDSFIGKRILLVDDNELNREIAVTILEEAGFEVDTASDGSAAVEKAKAMDDSNRCDLILMDIQMPVMDGYEATKNIRKLKNPQLAKIPIIAMTANAFDEDKQLAFEAGMDGHLSKPIEVEKFMNTLRETFS